MSNHYRRWWGIRFELDIDPHDWPPLAWKRRAVARVQAVRFWFTGPDWNGPLTKPWPGYLHDALNQILLEDYVPSIREQLEAPNPLARLLLGTPDE